MSYPILVERFQGRQSLTIVCERCHSERVITADDILNEGWYECPADTERGRTASTEPRCMGTAVMKYDEGDKCPGCGALGFYEDVLKGACSRKCMFVAEYAASLEAQR